MCLSSGKYRILWNPNPMMPAAAACKVALRITRSLAMMNRVQVVLLEMNKSQMPNGVSSYPVR